MNANKTFSKIFSLTIWVVALGGIGVSAHAVQGLDASGQTKVNNAMAKRWSEQSKGEKTPTDEKRVINVGSKRNGTCNVNIGTTATDKRGARQPKEVVVTTKEVINVCK